MKAYEKPEGEKNGKLCTRSILMVYYNSAPQLKEETLAIKNEDCNIRLL
jgi:hypothetical protein